MHKTDTSARGASAPSGLLLNGALGAAALISAARGHLLETGEAMPVPLAFVVLPMVFHAPTLDVISRTYGTSPLASFAQKFKGREDELLAIHLRALRMRTLTLDSMAIGANAGLLVVDYSQATVRPPDVATRTPTNAASKPINAAAEKLGRWFSRLPLAQTAAMLRLEF